MPQPRREKPILPQPPERIAITLTIVAAIVGAVLGTIGGVCYPRWSDASSWHRLDNAFLGAILACIGLGLVVQFSAIIALALVSGTVAWGLFIEVPIALIFQVVLPEMVPTIGRIALSAILGAMLVRWWQSWESREDVAT